jgi:hypothetical protein
MHREEAINSTRNAAGAPFANGVRMPAAKTMSVAIATSQPERSHLAVVVDQSEIAEVTDCRI